MAACGEGELIMARGSNLDYYKQLYDTVQILPGKLEQVKAEVDRIYKGYQSYKAVEAQCGVSWVFHAAIHEMECDCNFSRQILNGEKWDRVTTIWPVGLGPWKSWVESTVYALKRKRASDPTWTPLDEVEDWTIAICGREWEKWNGGGYLRRGKNSPYLWAGSNHGVGVGYYRADGQYDPTAQSKQIGAMVLLWALKQKFPEQDLAA